MYKLYVVRFRRSAPKLDVFMVMEEINKTNKMKIHRLLILYNVVSLVPLDQSQQHFLSPRLFTFFSVEIHKYYLLFSLQRIRSDGTEN
jgi:hypothetical protein